MSLRVQSVGAGRPYVSRLVHMTRGYMPPDGWLTRHGAAAYLDRCIKTVDRYIGSGDLTVAHAGPRSGRVLVSIESLQTLNEILNPPAPGRG